MTAFEALQLVASGGVEFEHFDMNTYQSWRFKHGERVLKLSEWKDCGIRLEDETELPRKMLDKVLINKESQYAERF